MSADSSRAQRARAISKQRPTYFPTFSFPAPFLKTMTQDSTAPIEISVTEAQALLRETSETPAPALLIDVREAHELEIARVDDALHIPLGDLPQKADTLPRDRPLFLLCHHGGRSRRATEYLRHLGFENATNVAGGIDAWALQIDPSLARY